MHACLCNNHISVLYNYAIYIHWAMYAIATAALVSTRCSAIFSLSHLNLGSKTFLYMLVDYTTLPCSLANCWMEHCWKLDCFKTQVIVIKCYQFLGCREILLNKTLKTVIRKGSMSTAEQKYQWAKCMHKYVLTQES